MKSANWISTTGTMPYKAMPTAQPTMPFSLSGVSITRSSPNSSCRPAVTRNTPPTLPTSSPITTTRLSRRIAERSASLTAITMFICGIAIAPRLCAGEKKIRAFRSMRGRCARTAQELGALLLQVPRRLLVHVVENRFERRWGRLFADAHGSAEALIDVCDQRLLLAIIPSFAALEVLAEPRQRIALGPRLQIIRCAVAIGIVTRGVAAHAVGDRFDQRRTETLFTATDGFTHHAHDCENVVAVDAHAGDAIGGGFLGEGLGGRLSLGRNADRPTVVATEEDHRHLEHAGKVHPAVEVGGAGGAVTEVHQTRHILAVDLGAPGEAD